MVAPLAWNVLLRAGSVLHLTGSYDGRSKCGGRAGQHRSMT